MPPHSPLSRDASNRLTLDLEYFYPSQEGDGRVIKQVLVKLFGAKFGDWAEDPLGDSQWIPFESGGEQFELYWDVWFGLRIVSLCPSGETQLQRMADHFEANPPPFKHGGRHGERTRDAAGRLTFCLERGFPTQIVQAQFVQDVIATQFGATFSDRWHERYPIEDLDTLSFKFNGYDYELQWNPSSGLHVVSFTPAGDASLWRIIEYFYANPPPFRTNEKN